MVKLVLDMSFIMHYVENFYSDNNRESARILNEMITPALNGKPSLVVSCKTMEDALNLYPGRELVLATLFDLCEKSSIVSPNGVDTLLKIVAVSEIDDKDTYVVSDDGFVISEVNKTSHKALSIKDAFDLVKPKKTSTTKK